MTRARYTPFDALGSYSSGDLRPVTVARAYLDIAREAGAWRGMTRADRARLRSLDAEYDRTPTDAEDADETFCGIIEEAEALANEYLPPGLYAGSHPGDGADIGVWIPEDFDVPDPTRPKVADPADLDTLPADVTEAYTVTDHGNVTLWTRDRRGRWHDLWAVV